jgi:oligopeptide transport system permease protein
MQQLILRRLFWMVPVLFVISIITFTLMHIAPGGPWDRDVGRRQLPPAVIENLNRKFHLNEPAWKQYVLYMWGAIRGDLGPSYQYKDRNVTDIMFAPPQDRPIWESRFGRTATLGLLAFLIAVSLGLPLGIISALKQNTIIDYGSLFFATIGNATPGFVMAIFLMVIFGLMLHWFPIASTNWDGWKPWVLPTVALCLGLMAYLARMTRATMLEAIRQDYIRTARSKGLSERVVIVRHALKNALIPVATVLGPALAGLITGSFFIEYMFSFPGMGRLYIQSVQQRDYSMIMGNTLFYAFLIALANLAVDLVYGLLDPRIKVGK